jgi:hypothetical protein
MRPDEWTAPWYCALIENARDDAGELGRIRSFISASCKLSDAERARLFALIEEYLPDAAPARAPRDETEAMLWANAATFLHDTTAYDDPTAELIFIDHGTGSPAARTGGVGRMNASDAGTSRSTRCGWRS